MTETDGGTGGMRATTGEGADRTGTQTSASAPDGAQEVAAEMVPGEGREPAEAHGVSAELLPSAPVVRQALDGVGDAAAAYSYDGERERHDHLSGAPERRSLVLGDEDTRDASLHERIEREETVYEGLVFDVHRLEVTLPDGRCARRDVLRHPGAVAVVALTDDGRICLVRQYRAALDRVTVEIPAGKLSPGEDPLEGARRELLEETGATAGRMAYLTTLATCVGFGDELIHLYMATGLSFGRSDPDDDEFIDVDVVALDELVAAVLDGRVEDAKTVVGALVCDAVLRRLEP